jgi:4,5-DOPA dioxygenase extradiol
VVVSPAPIVFLGHGNPMNALDHNRFTEAWRDLGEAAGRPRAVLCVSAHWYVNATAVTAMAAPRTIHDFYGFPDELFAVEYPAPGSPAVAEMVADVVEPTVVGRDHDSWGLDHGTWAVLVHVFPDADVPVVQLSVNATQPLAYHFELGSRLAPLRDEGILVMGSGNVVHNLGLVEWNRPEAAFDWTRRFDEAARELLTTAPEDVGRLEEHPDYALAVPTPDHFLPLVYVAGAAAAAGTPVDVLVDGYAMGSLSMTAVGAGVAPTEVDETDPAPPLPSGIPPEDTNT